MSETEDYDTIYQALALALRDAPFAQRQLLGTTDQAFAFLDERGEELTDDQYLGLKLMLSQAEAILTRYFGM